jgi:hypothetical protein
MALTHRLLTIIQERLMSNIQHIVGIPAHPSPSADSIPPGFLDVWVGCPIQLSAVLYMIYSGLSSAMSRLEPQGVGGY